MDDKLFEKTKVAAYFLWEYTHCGNSLNLWSCAEDIACFLEQAGFKSIDDLRDIIKKGYTNKTYIEFVRQIAYRIYVHTNISNAHYNWIAAEKLLVNGEWCKAVLYVAGIYRSYKAGGADVSTIRSSAIKNYYKSF